MDELGDEHTPGASSWPLVLASPESLVTAASIECGRCGTELLTGVEMPFAVAELLALVDAHAASCSGVSTTGPGGG